MKSLPFLFAAIFLGTGKFIQNNSRELVPPTAASMFLNLQVLEPKLSASAPTGYIFVNTNVSSCLLHKAINV